MIGQLLDTVYYLLSEGSQPTIVGRLWLDRHARLNIRRELPPL